MRWKKGKKVNRKMENYHRTSFLRRSSKGRKKRWANLRNKMNWREIKSSILLNRSLRKKRAVSTMKNSTNSSTTLRENSSKNRMEREKMRNNLQSRKKRGSKE